MSTAIKAITVFFDTMIGLTLSGAAFGLIVAIIIYPSILAIPAAALMLFSAYMVGKGVREKLEKKEGS